MIDLLILTGPAGCSSAILPGLDEYGYTTLSTDDLGKALWVRTTEPGFGSASMADCLRQYESIQGTVQMASEDAQFLNETRSQYPHAHARGVLEAITKTSDDAGIYPSLCNGSNKFVTEANSIPEISAWATLLGDYDVNPTIVVLDCINPEKRSYHNRDIPKKAYDLRMITITYRIENSHAVAQQLSEYLEKSQ
jgi:hypothetical protein